MEEHADVTRAKVAKEEFLLKALKENDLLHKRELNLNFRSKLVRERFDVDTGYQAHKKIILEGGGENSEAMKVLDQAYSKVLQALLKCETWPN